MIVQLMIIGKSEERYYLGKQVIIFFPTYITYSFLVCHPRTQLQLELWNRKRDRAMIWGISFEVMKAHRYRYNTEKKRMETNVNA